MWDAILSFLKNHAFMAAVCAWLFAQFFKFLIDAAINHKFSFSRLFGDGGMPSGHSATVMALATVVGYTAGWGSATFGVTLVLAVIVMHDATGVRRETGKQALDIIQLFEAINDILGEKDRITKREKLKVFVGHSPVQVFFGALLGVLVGILYILVFRL